MRAIYFDLETTGTKPERDRVIEIAAYDATDDKTFVSFVNPEMPISKESTQITGITDQDVQDAPIFHDIIPKWEAFLGQNYCLIAHNMDGFDRFFLKEEYKRANKPLEDYLSIDSLKWSRKYRPDLPRHALQYLREVYKVPANTAHRALDDVMVLYQVFSQMIDDLPIDVVHKLCTNQEMALRTMPFGKHRGKPLNSLPKTYIKWLDESGALEKNQGLKNSLKELGMLAPA